VVEGRVVEEAVILIILIIMAVMARASRRGIPLVRVVSITTKQGERRRIHNHDNNNKNTRRKILYKIHKDRFNNASILKPKTSLL
jgi:hypothetical protein